MISVVYKQQIKRITQHSLQDGVWDLALRIQHLSRLGWYGREGPGLLLEQNTTYTIKNAIVMFVS